MSRLSIELTAEQHQRLKAMAALQGKSIKEYVLERSLPNIPDRTSMTEEETLQQLEEFLKPGIEAAQTEKRSVPTLHQIFEDVQRDLR